MPRWRGPIGIERRSSGGERSASSQPVHWRTYREADVLRIAPLLHAHMGRDTHALTCTCAHTNARAGTQLVSLSVHSFWLQLNSFLPSPKQKRVCLSPIHLRQVHFWHVKGGDPLRRPSQKHSHLKDERNWPQRIFHRSPELRVQGRGGGHRGERTRRGRRGGALSRTARRGTAAAAGAQEAGCCCRGEAGGGWTVPRCEIVTPSWLWECLFFCRFTSL